MESDLKYIKPSPILQPPQFKKGKPPKNKELVYKNIFNSDSNEELDAWIKEKWVFEIKLLRPIGGIGIDPYFFSKLFSINHVKHGSELPCSSAATDVEKLLKETPKNNEKKALIIISFPIEREDNLINNLSASLKKEKRKGERDILKKSIKALNTICDSEKYIESFEKFIYSEYNLNKATFLKCKKAKENLDWGTNIYIKGEKHVNYTKDIHKEVYVYGWQIINK